MSAQLPPHQLARSWPKIGDRVRDGDTREGDVIGFDGDRVTVDWGLFITKLPIAELEPLEGGAS